MKILEYLFGAYKAGNFTKKKWVLESFAVIQQSPDASKTLKPFYILQTPTGYSTVDTEGGALIRIEDAKPGEPPLKFSDVFILPANTLPNQPETIKTTVGNFFFNAVALARVFKHKVKYQNTEVNINKLETEILRVCVDTPDNQQEYSDMQIYVHEYLEFKKAVFYLAEFAQLCVWGTTERVITPPPGIKEYRAKLLEEHKDKLSDPAVVAMINKKLVEFDANYLKGDPGADKFLSSAKARNVVRQRRYLMLGTETSLKDEIEVDPITISLSEGWDLKKFPVMMDSLRAGSFNRGAQTEKGGEAVKWLFRASSNISIGKDDCGSQIGRPMEVTEKNVKTLVGFSVITGKEPDYIDTEEKAQSYLGHRIMVRSTMYCKLDVTDYCKVCLGNLLASNPTGISMNVSEYGSIMLSIFMSAAHATALVTQEVDLQEAFS